MTLDDRISKAAEELRRHPTGAPPPIDHLMRRRRRRRVVPASVATIAAVVAVTLITQRGDGGRRVVSLSPSTPSSQPTTIVPAPTAGRTSPPSTATVPPTAPTLTPTSLAPPGSPPASFLGAAGAGNEQAEVIDTASGTVIRRLTAAPPGQLPFAATPDGRTLYAASQSANSCSRSYTEINAATGQSIGPAFTDVPEMSLVAPTADPTLFAYIRGCPGTASANTIYVHWRGVDYTTITVDGPAIQLNWSLDGTRIAYRVGDRVEVRPAFDQSASPLVLRAPDAGCRLGDPRFTTAHLFALEECPNTVAILSFDPTPSQPDPSKALGRWQVGPAGSIAADLAIDPTGRWALYPVNSPYGPSRVQVLDLGAPGARPRTITSDVYQVAWITG